MLEPSAAALEGARPGARTALAAASAAVAGPLLRQAERGEARQGEARRRPPAPQPSLHTLLGAPKFHVAPHSRAQSFWGGHPLPSGAHLLLHPSRAEHRQPGPSHLPATGFTSAKSVNPREPVSGGISARATRKAAPLLESAELGRPTDLEWIWGDPPSLP